MQNLRNIHFPRGIVFGKYVALFVSWFKLYYRLVNTQRLALFVYWTFIYNIGDDLFTAEVSRVVIIHRVLELFTNKQLPQKGCRFLSGF